MNAAEQIYQDVQNLPEPLALEVSHFVEFLKLKQDLPDKLEQKIQLGIEQAERGLSSTVNDAYAENLNRRVQERLAANRKA